MNSKSSLRTFEAEAPVCFEGQVEKIVFHNKDNGYTVAVLSTPSGAVTVTGSMPYIYEGENIRGEGEWSYHKNYGRQLKITGGFERVLPGTVESIQAYLSSGMFKGIGKTTAVRITEKFGAETLDIIAYYPDRLAEIKGITKKKARELAFEFEQQRELRDLTMFLQRHGLGPAFAPRVYKDFGSGAVVKISENPYLLADRIQGIGFKTADRIAFGLGIEKDSEFRIKSGIVYTLFRASLSGHTYLPENELAGYASDILDIGVEAVKSVFSNFLFERTIIKDGENVYLSSLYNAEKSVAFKLTELTNLGSEYPEAAILEYLAEFEKTEKLVLETEQSKAVVNSLRNGTSIITGGPGTGKTTIIKAVIHVLEQTHICYALCAPTGRAAKRMEEATGREAKTVHRLLEAQYSDSERELVFRRNASNPLEYEVIIVDEMSMVDISLFASLLRATLPGTRLVMVGDKDQLPSVGPGSVLRDLLKSGMISAVELKHIFRQDENSLIAFNAHRINIGEMPVIDNASARDFFVISRAVSEIPETIISLVTQRIPEKYSFDWKSDICVLTPVRKGRLGVEGLNETLRSVLNPAEMNKREFSEPLFREGDRVMQTKNDYGIKWHKYNKLDITGEGLYNGDIGFVISADEENGEVEVLFDNEKVALYERTMLDEIEPAFATTIHKSQGSEFNVVVIPLFSAPRVLMTRNLLYTALTRAKKLAVFVGDEDVLHEMVMNETENLRYTSLDKRLRQFLKGED